MVGEAADMIEVADDHYAVLRDLGIDELAAAIAGR